MKFVIAPDWLMQLPDDHILRKKHIWEIYGHKSNRSISNILSVNGIPKPDIKTPYGKCHRLGWTVKHVKNNVKLPTEIMR